MDRSTDLYRAKYWNTYFILLATFFFVVGGTLGGGIMVIPVEQATSGFWAFLLIMIAPFLAEVTGVILFMQVIQKVRKFMSSENIDSIDKKTKMYGENRYHRIANEPLMENENSQVDENNHISENYSEFEDEQTPKHEGDIQILHENHNNIGNNNNSKKKTTTTTKDKDITNMFLTTGIDLHTISSTYFPWYYGLFVDLLLLLESFPIVYIIGCSQTIVSIWSSDSSTIMASSRIVAPTIAIFSFLSVFLLSYIIEALISLMTCMKATLLLIVVLLGLGISSPFVSETNFLYFSRVFFAETWLICGSVCLIPTMFSKLRPSKRNILFFTIVVIAALAFSQFVSIIWSIVVWGIVPQDGSTGSKVNLKRSLKEGELSNIPFSILVGQKYPNFAWLGILIQIFIAISLTVSTLVFSTVFKSMVDGFIKQSSVAISKRFRNQNNEEQQQQQQQQQEEYSSTMKISIVAFQILSYLFTIIVASFCCWTFYRMEFFLTEVSSFLMVMIEIFFLCGLLMMDVFKNPFKGQKIWLEIPRPIFIGLSVIIGVYFTVFSTWFYIYSTIRWIYVLNDSVIPF